MGYSANFKLSFNELTAALGLAVRILQLGIEKRPYFYKEGMWAYPFYGGIGASFGYWMLKVERNQAKILADRRERLLEKRARRAERDRSIRDEQSGVGSVAATAQ